MKHIDLSTQVIVHLNVQCAAFFEFGHAYKMPSTASSIYTILNNT